MLKTIFTYPWDLSDEGVDRALDVIQNDAGLNGVSLAVAYHVATYFLPHNPRRKIYYGEDGMILFVPTGPGWGKTTLRPRVSEVVKDKEWLPKIAEKIKARGLHLTAWTVFLYNHHLAAQFPEAAKHDALGNLYPAQLCPANPNVRAYTLALVDDLARTIKPDAFYLESLSYLPCTYGFRNPKVFTPLTPRSEFVLGVCFCEHCLRAAGEGLDAGKFKNEVAEWLKSELPKMPGPDDMAPADANWLDMAFESRLQHYLAARAETATNLFEDVVKAIKVHGNIQIESALTSQGAFASAGLGAGRVNKLLDRLGVGVPAAADQVKPRRAGLAGHQRLLANIQPNDLMSEAQAVKTVSAARAAGVDGFTFYNYGLVRQEQLRWVGTACKEL
jgi:hypothetical protein